MQRASIAWRSEGRAIALIPTMGYLHPGHAGLIRRARSLVGRRGIVVVSIFVNPTQFAPSEDLAKYPRDLSRDRRLCQDNSVDALFLPSEESMYPGRITGAYSTYVTETCISQGMEGTSRPTHFQGVTTVVAKLFNCVLPHISVFGEKDFQQAAVIKRMTADLNFPIKIVIAPTTREADGLAMSSRNSYLSEDQRRAATC
ncbi:MAG: pantoate--beta-alanine ligase, partial [Verrucomicrobia bacterium]|nr:pantoate--beta-alanine ligase [Verrucomicrobiota bacterium]